MLKVETWLKRADAILAKPSFDLAAALALTQEIRNQAGPGSIGIAAGQALGSLQAADRAGARSRWQIAVAKQRLEEVRSALVHHASRT